MISYPDGTEIRPGDAVLLHHRTYTGVVHQLIETPEEIAAWNLEEVGLIIDTSYGGFVFYPVRSLVEEEVVAASPIAR